MNHRKLSVEKLDARRLLVADWQNPDLVCDVDNSALVTASDALSIINSLNEHGTRALPERTDPEAPYWDVSGDSWISPLDALVVVNALNRNALAPNVVVSPSPSSDPNANGVVLADAIQLTGQALPHAKISVTLKDEAGSLLGEYQSIANGAGEFALDLPMQLGQNQVDVSARDELGRFVSTEIVLRRGDIVVDWNAAMLNAIRDWTGLSNDPYPNRIVPSQPPLVAKNLAMVHAAIFDAINAVEGGYEPYLPGLPSDANASPVAAAAAAAYRVATVLYKDADERAVWDATLAESLATIPNDTARAAGLTLGRAIGDAMILARTGDGSTTPSTYVPTTLPGHWNRTQPEVLPPLLPHWGNVKTFAIPSTDDFLPPPPPALDSAEYAETVDEVMRLGALDSTERTSEQTEIAIFWADGGGSATPAGHWNRIAVDVMIRETRGLLENARTLALLNLATADAGIVCWDTKYTYDLWRPIDAIRRAAEDNNPATVAVADWQPLIKTPPFPTYSSGHSTFSGAAAVVLAGIFGDDVSFSSRADSHSGLTQRPIAEHLLTTRHFTSFSQAATEASHSRVYGGIHFEIDSSSGMSSGRAVGEYVVANSLRPR